jgi:serine/threonine protein kinase/Tfp pilus assembly protein PilF
VVEGGVIAAAAPQQLLAGSLETLENAINFMGLYEETMLGDETKCLFRDVADLSLVERERYFEEHAVPQDLRSEIESLLGYDSDPNSTFSEAISREALIFLEANNPGAQPTMAGQVLGAYTLVSEIGHGGMGSVWLAVRNDGRFEGRVAVKILNVALADRTGGARFRREGSILARLSHPHITRLLDAGVTPSAQPYLVLEFVEGEHIDRFCDSRGLNVETRIRLLLDVLGAIAHAHANLIVHRDIKPSNVLVTAGGQVKLLDFGIAKLLEDADQPADTALLTRENGCALTAAYAAPEQVTGGVVTTATDVYSSGALLFALLGGERRIGSVAESIQAIAGAEFPPIPGVRGDLATIVQKALKKNSAERYASAGAFAEDLRRYLDHEPIRARPDTWAYRTKKFLRRRWRGIAAAAATGLLIASFAGFYTVRLAAERNRARLEAEKANKVSDLLTSLLTASDPYATREVKEPTVRALLDAGAARAEKELTGQPELKAQLLTVMGRVYQRLGVYEKAQALLEEAVAIGRARPESASLAASLSDLGVLYRARGDYSGAAPALEEALAMRRRLLGPEHRDVAETIAALAVVYRNLGDLTRAESLLRESLRIRRKVLGDESPDTGTSMNDLGLVLWDRGQLPEAALLFRQSLAILRKSFGEDNANTASVLDNLALVTEDLGDKVTAEALFREGLAIRRNVLDPKHTDIALSLNNLSHLLRESRRYDEAEAALREALEIARPALGPDHPILAAYMANLGSVLLAQRKAAMAEPLIRQALEIRRRKYRPGDWRTAASESLLGEALMDLGRYQEARPLLLDAEQTLKDVPGSQGQAAAANRERLARLKADKRG